MLEQLTELRRVLYLLLPIYCNSEMEEMHRARYEKLYYILYDSKHICCGKRQNYETVKRAVIVRA